MMTARMVIEQTSPIEAATGVEMLSKVKNQKLIFQKTQYTNNKLLPGLILNFLAVMMTILMTVARMELAIMEVITEPEASISALSSVIVCLVFFLIVDIASEARAANRPTVDA